MRVWCMGIVVDNTFISNQEQNLKAAMSTDPKMRKVIQQHIREALFAARREVMNSVNFENGDPRHSAKAIRTSVYEKVLGANLNILNMKRGTASWRVRQVERKGTSDPKGRGGNRLKRNIKTIRMHGYEGKARGMILRWVNSGNKEERKSRYGSRGQIPRNNFFQPLASTTLNIVSQHLSQIIEEEIAKSFNENNNS